MDHEDANVEQYAKIADSMMAVAASASPFKTVNTVRQGDFRGRRDFNPVNNAADKSFTPRWAKTKDLQFSYIFWGTCSVLQALVQMSRKETKNSRYGREDPISKQTFHSCLLYTSPSPRD